MRLVGWHEVSEEAPADFSKNLLVALRAPWLLSDWDWCVDAEVAERKCAVYSLSQLVRINYLTKLGADLRSTTKESYTQIKLHSAHNRADFEMCC